jgi:hypothetical protein
MAGMDGGTAGSGVVEDVKLKLGFRAMSSGREPTASEVLDVMDRLQRDPNRRLELASGHSIFRACVDAGLVGDNSIDWIAQRMQELHQERLITHGPVSSGAYTPSVWDGGWIQSAHNWRVSAAGRADAALYRRENGAANTLATNVAVSTSTEAVHQHDLFLCHAGEDKEAVARPLSEALTALGWRVWLDELALTVGDSLSRSIDAALAQCRFGIVVLSPAFFAKQWPQRELSGLAAREVGDGIKVILPVWHGVDQHDIARRSPTLADCLGAPTTGGIPAVASEISRALELAGLQVSTGPASTPVLQSVLETQPENGRLTIPDTPEAQAQVVADAAEWWEHQLFAGVLIQGRDKLEPKWHDQEMHLPRGVRREFDRSSTLDFLARELRWITKEMGAVERIFDPAVQRQAFGAPGEPGDPVRIEHLAHRVLQIYESMLDWAATVRNTSVSPIFADAIEAAASMVDEPVAQMRAFIGSFAEQISRRAPELTEGGTEEHPVNITVPLTLMISDETTQRYIAARGRGERAL